MNNLICTEINDFYTSTIYPECPKKHLCDNGLYKFSNSPKMPYIGRDYGNDPKIPNLLFVSLDSGDEYENYHTIEEIRSGVESNPPKVNAGKDVVKHWYQTFDIASIILNRFLDDSIKQGNSYVDSYMAHSNSAKCTQNKENRKQADGNLFENCRHFVVKEIPLFNADIIITQGAPAHECLDSFTFCEKVFIESIHNSKAVRLPIYTRLIDNKKTLHIPMYHPSYYKGFWGQKQAIVENMQSLFIMLESIMQFQK